MVDQEATKKLHKAGFKRLAIQKSNSGYSIFNPNFKYQHSTPIRKKVEECIADAKNDLRPKERSLADVISGDVDGIILK